MICLLIVLIQLNKIQINVPSVGKKLKKNVLDVNQYGIVRKNVKKHIIIQYIINFVKKIAKEKGLLKK